MILFACEMIVYFVRVYYVSSIHEMLHTYRLIYFLEPRKIDITMTHFFEII